MFTNTGDDCSYNGKWYLTRKQHTTIGTRTLSVKWIEGEKYG